MSTMCNYQKKCRNGRICPNYHLFETVHYFDELSKQPCKYGYKCIHYKRHCHYFHDQASIERILINQQKRIELEQLVELRRIEEEFIENNKYFKNDEYYIAAYCVKKEYEHSGYCSDPGSINSFETQYIRQRENVPHFVKKEHVDNDGKIIDDEIIDNLIHKFYLRDEGCCGFCTRDLNIDKELHNGENYYGHEFYVHKIEQDDASNYNNWLLKYKRKQKNEGYYSLNHYTYSIIILCNEKTPREFKPPAFLRKNDVANNEIISDDMKNRIIEHYVHEVINNCIDKTTCICGVDIYKHAVKIKTNNRYI